MFNTKFTDGQFGFDSGFIQNNASIETDFDNNGVMEENLEGELTEQEGLLEQLQNVLSGQHLLPKNNTRASGEITCKELGLEPSDFKNNNLYLLAQAINLGYDIKVDDLYYLKKDIRDKKDKAHGLFYINNNIRIVGLNKSCGFVFEDSDDENTYFAGGTSVFRIGKQVKSIVIKDLSVIYYNKNSEKGPKHEFITIGKTYRRNSQNDAYYTLRPLALFFIEPNFSSDDVYGGVPSDTLIDNFTMTNCFVEGPFCIIYFDGIAFPSNQLSHTNYGIKHVLIAHNEFYNLFNDGNRPTFNLNCPNQNSIVSYNNIHNFNSVFFYSGLNNTLDYMKQARGNAEISYNNAYCDDDFFRIDIDPTKFHIPAINPGNTEYYCFALVENDKVVYHHNRVEGMKVDGRGSNIELYDLYANAKQVYYHDNIWKNIFKARTQFYSDSPITPIKPSNMVYSAIGRWQLIQAKGSTYPNGVIAGTREYCNNQFIITEDFLKALKLKRYYTENEKQKDANGNETIIEHHSCFYTSCNNWLNDMMKPTGELTYKLVESSDLKDSSLYKIKKQHEALVSTIKELWSKNERTPEEEKALQTAILDRDDLEKNNEGIAILYNDLIKRYIPRLILTTTFQKTIKIDGNIIDMPNLYGVGGDPMCEQFVFTNNNIKLRYVVRGLIDIGNFKQTSNPELSQDREFIINNNMFDIAETYISFKIKDEITQSSTRFTEVVSGPKWNELAEKAELEKRYGKKDEDVNITIVNINENTDKVPVYVATFTYAEEKALTSSLELLGNTIFLGSASNPKRAEILNNSFNITNDIGLIEGISHLVKEPAKIVFQSNIIKYQNNLKAYSNRALLTNTSVLMNNNVITGATIGPFVKTRFIPRDTEFNYEAKNFDTSSRDMVNNLYLSEKVGALNGIRTLWVDKTVQGETTTTKIKQDYTINTNKPLNTGLIKISFVADYLTTQTNDVLWGKIVYEPYEIKYDPAYKDIFKNMVCAIDKKFTTPIKKIIDSASVSIKQTIPILLLTFYYGTEPDKVQEEKSDYIVLPYVSYIDTDMQPKVQFIKASWFNNPSELSKTLTETEVENQTTYVYATGIDIDGTGYSITLYPKNDGEDYAETYASINYTIPNNQHYVAAQLQIKGIRPQTDEYVKFPSRYYPEPCVEKDALGNTDKSPWGPTGNEYISEWLGYLDQIKNDSTIDKDNYFIESESNNPEEE